MKKSSVRGAGFLLLMALLVFVIGAAGSSKAFAAGSYSISVNYTENVVTVYENGNPIKAFLCSTGTWTPTSGTYNMSSKYRWAMLKGNVWGQYCTVITGNIWFHSVPYVSRDASDLEYWEYDKLGTTCSAGCVRLAVRDVKWIYENCPAGTPVTFYSSSNPGPLGRPSSYHIGNAPEEFRGWDPTDTNPDNPWISSSSDLFGDAFDVCYYKSTYADKLASLGDDELAYRVHWVTYGISERLRASGSFDMNIYQNNYPSLGGDPYSLVRHYNTSGKAAGLIADTDISFYRQVFDPVFYADKYPDVKGAYGYDENKLLGHYIKYGVHEGRQASSEFDLNTYKNNYADLREAFGSDNAAYVRHYVSHGRKENRIVNFSTVILSKVFNKDYYLNKYPDLQSVIGDDYYTLMKHFYNYGIREGRQACSTFNINTYMNNYEDLRNAFGNDKLAYISHYARRGMYEGRIAAIDLRRVGEVFDAKYYADKYPDLRAAFGYDYDLLLAHFINRGIYEGRQAKAEFSLTQYRLNYDDIIAAFGNDYIACINHYIYHGKAEGRLGSIQLSGIEKVFDPIYYVERYSDLKEVLGTDSNVLLRHYILYGIREGRQPSADFSLSVYKNRYDDLRAAFGADPYAYINHYIKWGAYEGRSAKEEE